MAISTRKKAGPRKKEKKENMSLYQLLKENETLIFQLVKNGVLSYTMIRDLEIYNNYLEMKNVNKESKYLILSEDYEIGHKRIQQIVLNMEKRIN